MLKKLILALLAAIFGALYTAHKKDKEILKLNKALAQAMSYEEFSKTFTKGWEQGVEHGKFVQMIDNFVANHTPPKD